MKRRGLSYDVLQVRDGGQPRTVARVWCSGCTEHLDLTINSSHNPERIEQQARAKGWDCDKNRASWNRCPACKAMDKARSKGEPAAKAAEPIPAATDATARVSQAAAPQPAPTAPLGAKETAMTTTTVRAPTPDERTRVRHKLDGVFDDSNGMYLDGYSDQKVADDLKLPRKIVEQIREAAYGPIRTDPEIEQLRADITDLLTKASGLANRLAEVKKRFGAR